MALESGTYIDSLNVSNPPQSDSLTQSAGHLRLIKSTVKATFPNITEAVTGTAEQLNIAAALAASGKYIPSGVILDYAGAALPAGGYLWANGQAVSRSTYADLFAAIGTTYGAGNGTTTFNVPNYKDRYRVGKGDMGGTTDAAIINSLLNSTTLGDTYDGNGELSAVTLIPANLPAHKHGITNVAGVTSSDGAHSHSVSGTTNTAGAHRHDYTRYNDRDSVSRGSGSNFNPWQGTTSADTSSDGNHSHTVSGSTNTTGNHTHTVTVNGETDNYGAGESFNVKILPPSAVVNVIIKT